MNSAIAPTFVSMTEALTFCTFFTLFIASANYIIIASVGSMPILIGFIGNAVFLIGLIYTSCKLKKSKLAFNITYAEYIAGGHVSECPKTNIMENVVMWVAFTVMIVFQTLPAIMLNEPLGVSIVFLVLSTVGAFVFIWFALSTGRVRLQQNIWNVSRGMQGMN